LLKGEYGLKDICLGTPCLINGAGADKVIEKKLNKTQEKKLKKIGFALRKTLKKLT
jgi:malate/lactate dehydrogenase